MADITVSAKVLFDAYEHLDHEPTRQKIRSALVEENTSPTIDVQTFDMRDHYPGGVEVKPIEGSVEPCSEEEAIIYLETNNDFEGSIIRASDTVDGDLYVADRGLPDDADTPPGWEAVANDLGIGFRPT